MTRTVVAGNWKMNKTYADAKAFVENLLVQNLDGLECEVQLYVPAPYLNELNQLVKNTKISIGAQNVHQESHGAYTGEISVEMLNSIGIQKTLVGHSERRQYFNETDELVNKKTLLCLESGIDPIVCVGETIEERTAGITKDVLSNQVEGALKNIDTSKMKNIIIAYEPVWAIGTGQTATAEDANAACKFIRGIISNMYNDEIAENLVIQYGGSVKPENVTEILGQPHVNGALVGGASLEFDSFVQLIG